MLKPQRKSKRSHTKSTFKALVDAMLPETQDLAGKQGSFQFSDALVCRIAQYQIWSLNHLLSQTMFHKAFPIHLAKPTARMLNKVAKQLVKDGGNQEPINSVILHEAGIFAALSPNDRLRVISLLEQCKVSPFSLPIPFWNNPGMVLSIIGTVVMLNTIGYYSGWTGYGTTSLKEPEKRKIECFPMCWEQVGYPGPSKGYHSLRGYLTDNHAE